MGGCIDDVIFNIFNEDNDDTTSYDSSYIEMKHVWIGCNQLRCNLQRKDYNVNIPSQMKEIVYNEFNTLYSRYTDFIQKK